MVLFSFVLVALAGAVVFLGLGIGTMAHGGAYDRAHSTQYMALRLGAQAAALVLILLAILAHMH